MALVLINKGPESGRAWEGAAVIYDDGKLDLFGDFALNLGPKQVEMRKKVYYNWTTSPLRQLHATPDAVTVRYDDATDEQIAEATGGKYLIEGTATILPKEGK